MTRMDKIRRLAEVEKLENKVREVRFSYFKKGMLCPNVSCSGKCSQKTSLDLFQNFSNHRKKSLKLCNKIIPIGFPVTRHYLFTKL